MSLPTRAAVAVLGVAAVSCALVGATSSAAVAASGNGKSALAGSVPSWAQAAHKVGASDKSTQVDFRVYLNNRGGDAASQLAMAVSTPGSKQYGKFLTPAQYRAQFAPAQSDVDAVSTWLKTQGFKVGYVPDNHKFVEAVGNVAQASNAFGTTFSDYMVQGQTLRSNDSSLQVPSSLSAVQSILGLDESEALVHTNANYQPPGGVKGWAALLGVLGREDDLQHHRVRRELPNDARSANRLRALWLCGSAASGRLRGRRGDRRRQ